MNRSGLHCMTESRTIRKVPIQAITCIMRYCFDWDKKRGKRDKYVKIRTSKWKKRLGYYEITGFRKPEKFCGGERIVQNV